MPLSGQYFYTPCVQSQIQPCSYAHPNSNVPPENLSLSQLCAFPAVKNLLDNYQTISRVNMRMLEEIKMLKEEVTELATRRTLLETVNSMFSSGSDLPPDSFPEMPRAPSLSPDDSISQAGESSSQPALQPLPFNREYDRPPRYPFSVLWHLQDCQHVPGVVNRVNKSRPNMERCIRHPDGSPIGKYEWRAIMTSAKRAIEEVLRPLSPEQPLGTRTHYKNAHPDVWERAIASLEAQQPLTALCASHWKAEHVLGQTLVSRRSVEVRVARVKELRMLRDSEDAESTNNSDFQFEAMSPFSGGF